MVDTARTQLGTFLEAEGINTALSRSDFKFSDLKTKPEGMTVYIVLPEQEAKTYYRFMRLIMVCMIRELQTTPRAKGRLPVRVLIDEMATSIGGNLEILTTQWNLARGYGVQFWGFVQSVPQLETIFGKSAMHEILSGSGLTQYFRCNDPVTMDTIKNRAGTYTAKKPPKTTTRPDGTESIMENDEEKLDFFTSQDLYGLTDNKAILFKSGLAYPILQNRFPYFENDIFRARASQNPYAP